MKSLLTAVILTVFAPAAIASTVSIEAFEAGGNVVFTGSGSIDTTGLGPKSDFNSASDDGRSQFNLVVGVPAGDSDFFTTVVLPFQPLNASFFAFDVSGDAFGFQSNQTNPGFVSVNDGYSSGDAINFTWTAVGRTLAGLNLNFGTLAEFGNNTVTLSQGRPPVSTVPLPAGLPLLVGGLGLLGLAGHRKRRKL